MLDPLVSILFGWPTIILALVVTAVGLWKKWPALVAAGAVLCIPFAYYLNLYFGWFAFALPLLQFGSAYAARKERASLA